MKKSIWLAIIGAAALTGCQNEVMQQREYVPAPREDVEPVKPVVDNRASERQDVEPIRQQQDTPPTVQELPVMKGQFSDESAKESDPVIAKPDKKGDRKANRKGGRKGARGSRRGAGAATSGSGEYIVRSGDTPEKIARRHHVRLSALMEANNLTEESAKRLRIGQKLTIPPRKAGSKSAKSAKGGSRGTDPGKRAAGASVPAANPGEYIVRSGDTPEKIARRHHVRVSDLMAANNFSEDDARKLRIGQKIVIPEKGAASRKSAVAAGNAEKRTDTASQGQSKGRDLDDESTGSSAAPAAAPTAAAPAQLNRIEIENGYLVEVPRDMTAAEFAKLNGISEDELRRLNPDMPEEMLKKDSAYAVPKN